VFSQSEEAQALARYLASAEAQATWASGGRVAANREALPEMYSDPADRKLAELTLGARSLNFNAIERMPQGLALKLQQNVIDYSKGQSLDFILQQLAESALQEYRDIP
jgi:ABC-type Fe3+ transport system substrate-binding protein